MENDCKLIDAKPIKQFIVDGSNNPDPKKAFGYDAIQILAEIEYAPTVDAVEVVRCKDCKHFVRNSKVNTDKGECYRYGICCLRVKKIDDFCSYGERRTDND